MKAKREVVVPAAAYFQAVGRGIPAFSTYMSYEKANNLFEGYEQAANNYEELKKEMQKDA